MPNSLPLISVIVPCYNYGNFLAETLNSLLKQSWKHWECIIIDDGSTDNTKYVARCFVEIDKRFRFIFQENQGVSAARNAGVRVSSGAYVQFLDADDMLEFEKLEKQVHYLETHVVADIVYGSVRYIRESNVNTISIDLSKDGASWMPQVSGADVLARLVIGNIMVINAPLLRKTVFNDVLGFNKDLSGHEDWDFWIRCALAGKRFQFMEEDNTRALVRVHKSSASQNVLPMLMSLIRVREQLLKISLPSVLSRENRYQSGLILARIARTEFRNRRFIPGLKHSLLAICRSNFNISIVLQIFSLLLPEKISKNIKSVARRLRILP